MWHRNTHLTSTTIATATGIAIASTVGTTLLA